MTVRELINELSKYPQDVYVYKTWEESDGKIDCYEEVSNVCQSKKSIILS